LESGLVADQSKSFRDDSLKNRSASGKPKSFASAFARAVLVESDLRIISQVREFSPALLGWLEELRTKPFQFLISNDDGSLHGGFFEAFKVSIVFAPFIVFGVHGVGVWLAQSPQRCPPNRGKAAN